MNFARGAIIVGSLFWTHFSIEQWHELPDDVTRKDGHGNVSVTPRPTTSGDSADGYSREQQQRADPQDAHEHAKKKNAFHKAKWQAAKGQYPGNHRQAPSGQPQPAEAGERQPDDDQKNKLLGDATQLRGHADPRPHRQDHSDEGNGGNNKSSSSCQAGMKFRQAKHQDQRARYSQHKPGEAPTPRGRSSGDWFANSSARGFDSRPHEHWIVGFGDAHTREKSLPAHSFVRITVLVDKIPQINLPTRVAVARDRPT